MVRRRDVIQLSGIDCYLCKIPVEKTVGRMEGVVEIHINPVTEKALVEYDTEKISLETIKEAIVKTGYKVTGISDEH